MLIEKKGFTEFKVVDSETAESFYVTNDKFLTELGYKYTDETLNQGYSSFLK